MCGRYALALSNEEVYDALQNQLPQMFEEGQPRWERPQDYRPNYNVAPRQRAPVIHRDLDSGEAVLETMQWGLVPHWTKHPPTGAMNTINARSESLLDATSGGMWHALKGHKRCVVPAQGYYEWLKKPSAKIAHFTRLPLTPTTTPQSPPLIFFAGLWDTVTYLSPVESRYKPDENAPDHKNREAYPTGNPIPLSTFTIMTTEPAADLRWLHDRMPCVLTGWQEVERWLDSGGWKEGKGGTGELLRSKEGLDCYPVPPEVGRIGTNSPTYIQPVSERSDGIKSFFQKQQPSPAKKATMSKAPPTPPPVSHESLPTIDDNGESKEMKQNDMKAKAEGIESELPDGDVEKGLGDDSNAPNPDASRESKPSIKDDPEVEGQDGTETTPGKRKRDAEEGNEIASEKHPKKGGRQTRVVRRAPSEEGNQAQPAITTFFKSPEQAKPAPAPKKPITRRSER